MKILVLQGSIKGEKGITELLVKKFLSGVMKAEPSCCVEVEYLCTSNIHNCSGCLSCWAKTPGKCRYEDDMTDLVTKYREADIIVAASPLYFDSMSSHMKKFWERMLPLLDPHFEHGHEKVRHRMRDDKKRALFVISTCTFPEVKQFDALVLSFKRIAYNLKMEYIGHILRPECYLLNLAKEYKDKIEEVLSYIQSAGEEMVKNSIISMETIEGVQQSITGDEAKFIKINNRAWDKAFRR